MRVPIIFNYRSVIFYVLCQEYLDLFPNGNMMGGQMKAPEKRVLAEALQVHKEVATLGQRIRAARKQQGLTQAELAGLAGVGARFVSDVENGKPTAQLGLVLHLLNLVGVELVSVERWAWPEVRRRVRASGPQGQPS